MVKPTKSNDLARRLTFVVFAVGIVLRLVLAVVNSAAVDDHLALVSFIV